MNKNRFDNFSDGVFAIAVTLLILNVRIPDSKNLDNHHLNLVLYHLIPHVVTFAFSFLVIGVFWVAHHRIFSFIKVLDSRLLWLNILYLLFIAIIPLPAAILSENPFLPTSILLYTITLFVIAMMHFVLLEYANRNSTLTHDALTSDIHQSAQRNALVGPVCYVAAAVCSFFYVYASFFFIVAAMVFYIFFAGKSKVEEKLVDVAVEEAM
jgi:uncharacterized membrane protein